MIRRIRFLLTLCSLLLCVGTGALWVRSYLAWDFLDRYDTGASRLMSLQSMSGRIEWDSTRYVNPAPRTEANFKKLPFWHAQDAADLMPRPHDKGFSAAGFTVESSDSADWHWWRLGVPHWFAAVLFAAMPLLRIRAILKRRKRGRALRCPTCGYDLRASPDRCPECGALASKGATT